MCNGDIAALHVATYRHYLAQYWYAPTPYTARCEAKRTEKPLL